MARKEVRQAPATARQADALTVAADPRIRWVRRRILGWGRQHYRAFPWREDRDPFNTLITEVLLKQTGAARVPAVRHQLLSQYGTPVALSSAEPNQIRSVVHRLGFGSQRSADLIALGQIISRTGVPRSLAGLRSLPGVGSYTAAAVACFAYGRRLPALDVNVARIIGRVFGISPERGELRKNPQVNLAASALAKGRSPRELNWSLLDLGAGVCRPRPRCQVCPLVAQCDYAQESTRHRTRELTPIGS